MWMMRGPLSEPAKEDMPSVAHAAGVAKRRRQHRLPQILRYELLTVAMLLAERETTTPLPRGLKQAKSGEGGEPRHEQQSIRMALAPVLHHSYCRLHTKNGAPRSQNTATTAGRGGRRVTRRRTQPSSGGPPSQAGALPVVRGRAGPSHGGGHRTGNDDVLWSRSSRVSCRCRFSMFLCRRSS